MDDEIPALTIYRKRDVNIETERKPKTRTTEITADEFYVAVLSNEAKVVLGQVQGSVRGPVHARLRLLPRGPTWGEDIPEAAFPRCIRRAAAELARMRDVYAVAPRPGLDPCEAEAMALCAIADAVYEFDQEDEGPGAFQYDGGQRQRKLHRPAGTLRHHPGPAGPPTTGTRPGTICRSGGGCPMRKRLFQPGPSRSTTATPTPWG